MDTLAIRIHGQAGAVMLILDQHILAGTPATCIASSDPQYANLLVYDLDLHAAVNADEQTV